MGEEIGIAHLLLSRGANCSIEFPLEYSLRTRTNKAAIDLQLADSSP